MDNFQVQEKDRDETWQQAGGPRRPKVSTHKENFQSPKRNTKEKPYYVNDTQIKEICATDNRQETTKVQFDLAVPKDTLIEKYVSKSKESEEEKQVRHFPCNFCDKSFDNDKGRKIHIGKMHKEDLKENGISNCDLCEYIGNSKELLTRHVQLNHIFS